MVLSGTMEAKESLTEQAGTLDIKQIRGSDRALQCERGPEGAGKGRGSGREVRSEGVGWGRREPTMEQVFVQTHPELSL